MIQFYTQEHVLQKIHKSLFERQWVSLLVAEVCCKQTYLLDEEARDCGKRDM